APFEGLGSIAGWLGAAGCEVSVTRLFETPRLPVAESVDFLIVMGGPMSANDETELAWLAPEKAFIRRCIEHGKLVLGVCLGAQLIASALGARVFRAPAREIGWLPVRAVRISEEEPGDDDFAFPASIDAFHWHGETFDLPPGAKRLAESDACENQAFQLGRRVLGLQFHLETTPESAREMVSHCRAELEPSRYVQSEAAILGASAAKYAAVNGLMSELLASLLKSKANLRPAPR
ncbi:MAG TPA: type 1 glutamine amidotransferase, partial [Gammaproteobacteria bacterium]|nr:type 1 glutamine amidotransferase [Gammaproteobacteria bacterium]